MLILPLLETIKFPEDPEQRRKLFGLSDKPSTRKQFLSLLQDVLLLPYGYVVTICDMLFSMINNLCFQINSK